RGKGAPLPAEHPAAGPHHGGLAPRRRGAGSRHRRSRRHTAGPFRRPLVRRAVGGPGQRTRSAVAGRLRGSPVQRRPDGGRAVDAPDRGDTMKEVKSWSDSPFDRVLSARDVSARGEVLGQNGGESTIVYALATQPEWLVKLYKRPLSPAQASVLDQVIALPDRMGAADRAVVDRSAAWPVARVVDEDTTVGVVMARAPACFTTDLWSPRTGRTRRALLTVDHL